MKLTKATHNNRIRIESEFQSTWFDDYFEDDYGCIALISCGEIISEIREKGAEEFLLKMSSINV